MLGAALEPLAVLPLGVASLLVVSWLLGAVSLLGEELTPLVALTPPTVTMLAMALMLAMVY